MRKNEPIDLSILAEMLSFISAERPREDWVRLLMAAKSEFGEAAKGTMQVWSATASNFDTNAFNSTWKSIKAGGEVTIGTLIHEAKENGYKFAPMSSSDKKRLISEQFKRSAKRKRQELLDLQKREQGYLEAKSRANKLINERSFKANSEHPYFVSKGINNVIKTVNQVYQIFNTLLVPVYQFKVPAKSVIDIYEYERIFELVSLQFIDANGGKRFLSGGKIKGGFFPIRFEGHIVSIVVCEGLATGVTYAKYYDQFSEVVCAFNASNLKEVAKAFKVRYPMARVIVAGDNDRFTERKTGVNTGVIKAKEAARLVDGVVDIPEFKASEAGSDWNDRYLLDISMNQVGKGSEVGL